ncbi:uncharacterized protein LOC103486514 isoform X1 [Cucumis melo]|uniref:Uncharacterized protein LOC103486514 isoform X1 n=1 Tax=Cucumis melo TaxID=3656 RepID=A0ABM3KQS6_CUCME|nr:uncharacterized protein LOC103486514 isoform X1 [Cucumis melo]
MSKKGLGGGAALSKDAPWRASGKPIPKIHHAPLLRISQSPFSDYALAVMKHPDPIGSGLATDAVLEAAGPDCIVPGQSAPVKLLGLKVWPIDVDLKVLEPVGRELKLLGKVNGNNSISVFRKIFLFSLHVGVLVLGSIYIGFTFKKTHRLPTQTWSCSWVGKTS